MIQPLALCALLFSISFVPRYFPFLFGSQLKKSVHLHNLARSLPPCIMLLLVAHALHKGELLSYPQGISQVAGVLAVVITHLLLRKALISMAAGFFFYQLLLHLL